MQRSRWLRHPLVAATAAVAGSALGLAAAAGCSASGGTPAVAAGTAVSGAVPPGATQPVGRSVPSGPADQGSGPDRSRAGSAPERSGAAPGTVPGGDAPGGDVLDVPPAAPSGTGRLTRSTTAATLPAGALAAGPPGPATGLVLHPRTEAVLWSAPGGRAVAVLPDHQLGSPTWVPVVATRGGWSQVLLPSRPNGSSAWVYSDTDGFDLARTDAVVRVDLASQRMTVTRAGRRLGSWPVVVGAPGTPTPRGTTFVMASVFDPTNAYSSHLLPLGSHSATLDSFGGGPGTVAVHGWRDPTIFRRSSRALSHGCIRVPAGALALARGLPLGTPVVVV